MFLYLGCYNSKEDEIDSFTGGKHHIQNYHIKESQSLRFGVECNSVGTIILQSVCQLCPQSSHTSETIFEYHCCDFFSVSFSFFHLSFLFISFFFVLDYCFLKINLVVSSQGNNFLVLTLTYIFKGLFYLYILVNSRNNAVHRRKLLKFVRGGIMQRFSQSPERNNCFSYENEGLLVHQSLFRSFYFCLFIIKSYQKIFHSIQNSNFHSSEHAYLPFKITF